MILREGSKPGGPRPVTHLSLTVELSGFWEGE